MRTANRNRFAATPLAVALLLLGCAGKSTPSRPGAEAPAPGGNELSSIQVEDRGGALAITVAGSAPMSPNIFKLTDPHRIIVDLTDTKLGSVAGPIEVRNGGINEITLSQFDDAANSLSRVVIGMDEPLEYEVESQGTRLVVKVQKGVAAAAPPSEEGLPQAPAEAVGFPAAPPPAEFAPLEALPAGEPEPQVSETPVAEAPAAEPPDAAIPAIGEATALTDIQYSTSEAGTTVRLIADGAVANFEDLILSDPNRLVVDLVGLKNNYRGAKTIPLGTSQIRQVRIGTQKGKLRVVMDVAGSERPAYTIDRVENALAINVAAVAETTAAGTAAVAQAEPAEAEIPAFTAPAPTEAPPAAEAQTFPEPEPAQARARKRTVRVTNLGFKQLQAENKSRIVVSLTEPVSDYRVVEKGPQAFALEIPHSRFDRVVLRRAVDTSQFRTAVVAIEPEANAVTKTTSVLVRLDQQVPYQVSEEGRDLLVDVEIPARIERAQVSAPTVAAEALPPPPVEETHEPAAVPEQEPSEFIAEEGRRERIEVDEAPKEGRPKDYRYVREGFMSDSAGGFEPLTEMGAILAGQYRGRRFTGRKISLDFKDADIRSIFRLIADISKLNVIVSDDVQGRVTVRLENVPWDQAFAIILQTKGLWFEKYGNIVRIAPAEKLRQERELAAAAEKASQAAKPLDILFKPVSYATASDMVKQVQSVLTERGSVDIDSRTNTLIVRDIRENLEKAKRMVDILDTQTPQVSIEARIVEANTNYTRSFGIVWGGQARFTPQTGNPTGVFFPNSVGVSGVADPANPSFSGLPVALNYPSPLGANAAVGIRLGSINNILDLDLALSLLETKGHAKLISSPKITVLDNKSASIQAGSKVPFLTQTANAGSNVRFENATTSINVTPHITNDGSVSMKISATRNEPNFAQLVQGNPLVDQRSADTEVLVKSGNTTVLGGIYSIRTGSTEDSLPYLSRIPVLGWLFKNYSKELKRTELLIFVTPRIVGDEREAVRDIRG